MAEPIEVACIICGITSRRTDWQDNKPHACDSHPKADVQAAIIAAAKVSS
jgi:hypothetical protein